MIDWKIGCSGYLYPQWQGGFYPFDLPKNKWLEFYCEHFNTIELNQTFFKFPRTEFLRNMYTRTPAGFTFSVKAPRAITHFKKVKGRGKNLQQFYNVVQDGLKEKAGPVLFQFPSTFEASTENIERIAGLLEQGFTNVVEFRHPSWWNEEWRQQLSQFNATFAGISHPQFADHVVISSPVTYYRFLGIPHLYHSPYGMTTIEKVSNTIANDPEVKQAYLYFGNTISTAAVSDARQFEELISMMEGR